MGFFYLFNCHALASGPHIILYRVSGMKEHDAFWRCFQVVLLCGFTQLLRMFLATLVHLNFDIASSFGLFNYECLGMILNFCAIRLIYSYLVGRGEVAVFIGSIGWSFGDLIYTKFIPLWTGTRGLEFDWIYLSLSFDANMELVFNFLLFFTVWLLMRKERNTSAWIASIILYVISSFHLSIFGLLENQFATNYQKMLASKLVFTIGLGLIGLALKVSWTTETPHEPKKSSDHRRSAFRIFSDLICGTGTYCLQMVRRVVTHQGVELQSQSVGKSARRNH